MIRHQFSIFTYEETAAKAKVPLSKKSVEEVKALIARGDGNEAAIKLRDLRERLEDYCDRIKT